MAVRKLCTFLVIWRDPFQIGIDAFIRFGNAIWALLYNHRQFPPIVQRQGSPHKVSALMNCKVEVAWRALG